jgi:hypothetical protein
MVACYPRSLSSLAKALDRQKKFVDLRNYDDDQLKLGNIWLGPSSFRLLHLLRHRLECASVIVVAAAKGHSMVDPHSVNYLPTHR